MEIFQITIQIALILFLLSMISEKIIDFLKHYLSDSYLFGIQKEYCKIGDTLTKFPQEDLREQVRKYRILKINLWSGILISTIIKADISRIFARIKEPGKVFGWNNLSDYETLDFFLLPFGIILAGCFISFGSKFWHDFLDLLFQVKNTKRKLADPELFQADNTNKLQKLLDTYQSDFIKAAYLEARTKFMAMESVKAIGIKSNDIGYYFEITVCQYEPSIEQYYQYLLEDGTPQNIPIKIVLLESNDNILAQSVDLSAKIFELNNPDSWGTLGVLVKPIDESNDKRYLLTCCHNIVKPIRNIPDSQLSEIQVGTIDSTEVINIGTVFKASRDFEMDAALIEIDTGNQIIINSVPKMGNPQRARQLVNRDAGNETAYIFGARSGREGKSVLKGTVTGVYNTIKVDYENQTADLSIQKEEFTLINTISISNNGKAISKPGDSGACVLDSENNVIGLVVAGNRQVTYALPIKTLLNKLNVQLI